MNEQADKCSSPPCGSPADTQAGKQLEQAGGTASRRGREQVQRAKNVFS